MKIKRKTIYCPVCERRVAEWDGKSTIPIIAECKKCNKRIVYDMDSDMVFVKRIPPRTSSSSQMFY